MKFNYKREYKSVHVSNMRIQTSGQCKSINLTFRLESANDSLAHRVAIERVILPALAETMKEKGYSPGPEPCVDCLDCQESDCEHLGKDIGGE